MINKNTKLFISLAQSPGNKGANFYNNFFKKNKINALYLPLKLKERFKTILKSLSLLNVKGCSVSMPFKQSAWQNVDYKALNLSKIKSVNTIIFKNKKTYGYSTDLFAVKLILKKIKIKKNDIILILGTGSIANIFFYILKKKTSKIFFVSRKKNIKNYLNLLEVKKIKFTTLINASPFGMIGYPNFPISKFNFNECDLIIDAVSYTKNDELKKFSKKNKIKYIGGDVLAKIQSKKQLEIYKKQL